MGKTTKKIIGPADGYVKLTSGENMGNLHHIRGGKLSVTQDSAQPDDNAPVMGELSESDKDYLYFGLGSDSEYLYGKADKAGVEISVTPAIED